MSGDEELPSTHRRILELLRRHGTMSIEEIAEVTGLKVSTIRKYTLELEKKRLVVRYGRKVVLNQVGRAPREASLPFFFVDPSRGTVVLQVSSLSQLSAALSYRLVPREAISYALRSGYLAAWLRYALGEDEVAKLVEELSNLETDKAVQQLLKALHRFLDDALLAR